MPACDFLIGEHVSMTLQLYAGGPADSDDHGCTIGDVSEKFPRPRADRDRRAVVLVGYTGIDLDNVCRTAR